jgi:hypothetical protein
MEDHYYLSQKLLRLKNGQSISIKLSERNSHFDAQKSIKSRRTPHYKKLGKDCDKCSFKPMQRLRFQIVLQPHQPSFSAVARLLVTAKGRAIVEATTIDMNCPSVQPPSDARRLARDRWSADRQQAHRACRLQ